MPPTCGFQNLQSQKIAKDFMCSKQTYVVIEVVCRCICVKRTSRPIVSLSCCTCTCTCTWSRSYSCYSYPPDSACVAFSSCSYPSCLFRWLIFCASPLSSYCLYYHLLLLPLRMLLLMFLPLRFLLLILRVLLLRGLWLCLFVACRHSFSSSLSLSFSFTLELDLKHAR